LTTLFVYIAQRCHGVMTSITLLEGEKEQQIRRRR